MRTLILDGSWANDPVAAQVRAALDGQITARGWDADHLLLREQKIGNCAGDFFCWVKTPGVCMTNDANRQIAAAMVRSDLLIYLTPVTFGGYSSALKRVVDHQIQNLSPYFTTINAETHHQRRYQRYPAMLVIGWLDGPDATSEAVFGHLAQRNALNMHAPTTVCGTLYARQSTDEIAAQVASWISAVEGGASSRLPDLPDERIAPATTTPLRRALLLVGSPRTDKSSSAALGEYLLGQLERRGVAGQRLQIYTALGSATRMDELLAALDAADLALLSFPLYIDSLPGPVVAALEQIAARRGGRSGDQRMAAIANCGFPEAHHNLNALAICEIFARQAGFAWAGSLALGQGAGMIDGQRLERLGLHIAPVRRALGMAAEGLALGGAIPLEASELMARPIIPSWLYTLVGGLSWGNIARRYAAQRTLDQQPYKQADTE
jgi:multimeric flavodoxin WrbA